MWRIAASSPLVTMVESALGELSPLEVLDLGRSDVVWKGQERSHGRLDAYVENQKGRSVDAADRPIFRCCERSATVPPEPLATGAAQASASLFEQPNPRFPFRPSRSAPVYTKRLSAWAGRVRGSVFRLPTPSTGFTLRSHVPKAKGMFVRERSPRGEVSGQWPRNKDLRPITRRRGLS